MKKLAVIGPGLLGGSLALAARAGGQLQVAIWARRPEAVAEIEQMQLADLASTELEPVVAGADIIVLCVPIGAMADLARQIVRFAPPHAIVTDVGSVKASVVRDLGAIFTAPGARFVGSHPMAGSEKTGIAAARADLFQGAVCIVTPDEQTDPAAVEQVRAFWESFGSTVRTLSPAAHDEAVALISHFPHLLAALLVNTVDGRSPLAFELAGPGFRDTTRVASGAPDMWTEILATNAPAIRSSAEALIENLREFIRLLDCRHPGDTTRMKDLLTHAKVRRDAIRQTR